MPRIGDSPRCRRSTPTCVGTMCPRCAANSMNSVHPHVRGDDSPARWRLRPYIGPPPRAWGRSKNQGVGLEASRSTPTCVGTMPRPGYPEQRRTVHPHVRGDDAVGSHSPYSLRWSTPTCVGTICRRAGAARSLTVHPHVRGDDAMGWEEDIIKDGPPPRAWGRFPASLLGQRLERSTPTCVGTMLLSGSQPHISSVHPHVRGDDSTTLTALPRLSGPPPRAWGRSVDALDSGVADWSTPTCVGTIHEHSNTRLA